MGVSPRVLRKAANQIAPMGAGQFDQHRDARRIRRSHDRESVAILGVVRKPFPLPALRSCANPQAENRQFPSPLCTRYAPVFRHSPAALVGYETGDTSLTNDNTEPAAAAVIPKTSV